MRAAVADALRATPLQWTRFNIGFCLDFYGLPHVRSHLSPFDFVVDMRAKAAAVPGSGDDAMTFTYSYDVARFVVAALGLDRWEEESYTMGDKTTWNEFVKMAEDARGESPACPCSLRALLAQSG
jgi:nucleoside-diphosphate-sugar epimerase